MPNPGLSLPGAQLEMIEAVVAAVREGEGLGRSSKRTPVVAVLVHGGSMDISGVLSSCDAVLTAFYPGMCVSLRGLAGIGL